MKKKGGLLAVLILVIAGVLAYANTLDSPFVFDDLQNIVENPAVRLTSLAPAALLRAARESPAGVRPVAALSFALNYYVDKYDPLGYHVVNIAIHILTAIFLYLFLAATFTLPYFKEQNASYPLIAFFAALLWLVHPVQTQSVTYIVQRMNSMAAMFYVLACFFYVKARLSGTDRLRRLCWFGGCVVAGLLACGAKEMAITLPFMLFVYEWFFLKDCDWRWFRKRLPVLALLLCLVLLAAFLFLGANPLDRVLNGYDRRDFTMGERLLTQFRVVVYYVGLLLFPSPGRLTLDYDFALSRTLFSPLSTFFAMAAVIAALLVAVFGARRHRLLSFSILWFLGNLAIESSVIPLEIIFEHRTYLPSMFFVVILVYAAFRSIGNQKAVAAGLGVIAVLFTLWTVERNALWREPVLFWQDNVRKAAEKPRPYNYLGMALLKQGRLAEARRAFQGAIRLDPGYAQVYANLGVVAEKEGRADEAVSCYRAALRIDPALAAVHNSIGFLLAGQGRFDEGISHFQAAVRLNPGQASAHNNLGVLLQRQGRLAEAVSQFRQALAIDAGYRQARANLDFALQLLNSKGGKKDNN